MSKILVVCYSRSGKTRKTSEEIANKLNADFEEIIDTKNRKGIIGFILSGRDALKKKSTIIKDIKYDPNSYDMIIIGTPVWASTISTPVLTYIEKFKNNFKNVCFFFTQGGNGKNKVFHDLIALSEKAPLAVTGIYGNDFKSQKLNSKIDEFVKQIKEKLLN
jgi:flavodoxin